MTFADTFSRQAARACALATLLPLSAGADSPPPAPPGVSTGAMLQTFLGLLLILGLFFLAAYLLRKLNGSRAFGGNALLRVLGGIAVGSRERIVLVEVGDTWLVVGIAPGQIRTLHTMPKGETPPAGIAVVDKPFGQWLKQVIERKHETS